jgi:hypothetical protein
MSPSSWVRIGTLTHEDRGSDVHTIMSFRLFIYYCAVCGGCAAYLGWILGRLLSGEGALGEAALKGMFLGMIVALALGLVDALWSFSASQVLQVVPRVLLAGTIGALGGLFGGLIGQFFYGWLQFSLFLIFGWTITGLLIGSSLGVFDILARLVRGEDLRGAQRKIRNGVLGGAVGGLVGGVLFLVLKGAWIGIFKDKPSDALWSPSASGFVALGLCIGLLIGLAQVILKVAWVRVEAGFRPGRELILSRPEVTIGRAESCDIGLFGDNAVERLHARIVQRGGEYYLADNNSSSGTFVNDRRVGEPVLLRSGDVIRLGRNVLCFRESRRQSKA